MKEKMFIDLLLAVKRGCETGDRGKFIGFIKSSFALFEVFEADTFHIHWVPVDLA